MSSVYAIKNSILYKHISGCACFLCVRGRNSWEDGDTFQTYHDSLNNDQDVCLMCTRNSGQHASFNGRCPGIRSNKEETFFASEKAVRYSYNKLA